MNGMFYLDRMRILVREQIDIQIGLYEMLNVKLFSSELSNSVLVTIKDPNDNAQYPASLRSSPEFGPNWEEVSRKVARYNEIQAEIDSILDETSCSSSYPPKD